MSIDEHAINIAIMGAVAYATDTLRFKSAGTPLYLKIFTDLKIKINTKIVRIYNTILCSNIF